MLKKITSNRILNIHFVVWIIYTVYFTLIIKFIYNAPFSFDFIAQTVLHRIGDIGFFYINIFLIFPKYLNLKRWLPLILSFVILIFGFLYYKYLLEFYIFQFFKITIPNDVPIFSKTISQAIIQVSNFTIYSLTYTFAQRFIQQQKELATTELELAEQKARNAILEKEKS